ncbi:hypothetical protein GCK72_010305 [Caenorhabditis remanei]|uniref:T-box domain-containing protein n=1 Tax=Caenorhabditis remanei TaxID=31234 RepID=A0A6A5H690_CAERE|nr:hypothetical protein GCK72_010305 [Caenorhabditis remanei]KAF1762043.1 hypothetical protein GCK72_010305 [Caenorhabditis remanei]
MDSLESPSGIRISLSDKKTWNEFYPKTEMIVTKKKGRVIFPHLNYNLKGMEPGTLYTVHIHLERVDHIKYKFDAGEWQEFGKGEPVHPIKYKEHPDGARPGSHWMKETVSFSHLKITNDAENKDNKLILVQSMHKYRPVVTITKHGGYPGEEFRLALTEFIVVTAYQSDEMIKLKVAHNKFASGFRSNGKRRNSIDSENTSPGDVKRRSTSSESSSSSPLLVSPPNFDSVMNPMNPLTPIEFNQNPYPTQPIYPMQNQVFDFNSAYWNSYYQQQQAYWNHNQMNMMNQWSTGNPMNSENAHNGFGGI